MKYSWFYFDLVSENGLKLIIVFYYHPFFLSYDISLCDVCIYQGSKKNHFGFTDHTYLSKFETHPVDIRISESRLIQKNDYFLLQIYQKSLEIELELKPRFSSWSPVLIPLFIKNTEYFNWRVYDPYLLVQGSMRMNESSIDLKGRGYLDYNEGNFLLNKYLKSWIWGRLIASNQAILFGSLDFIKRKRYQPFLIVNDNGYQLIEVESPIRLETSQLLFTHSILNHQFLLKEKMFIDSVNFLVSRISLSHLFFRKLHEFIFYRLDECEWGKKINKPLSNVHYLRSSACIEDNYQNKYQGIIEQMKFV